jgi:nucleoside-diphosphate kinase
MENFRLSFVVEYIDPQASLLRKYLLLFYPGDSTVEMFDVKNHRVFLKRVALPQLSQRDLFIGANVTIFSRSLTIVDFGDEATRREYRSRSGTAIVAIGGDALGKAGEAMQAVLREDVLIINVRLCCFTADEARTLGLPSDRWFVMELRGSDVAAKVQAFRGSSSGIVCHTEPDAVALFKRVAFDAARRPTATFSNCAVLVVKPHAVTAHAGTIVQRLQNEGFEITALSLVRLSRADAEDLLEVYAGVVPEHRKLVDHLSSGQMWALEVRAENSVQALRAVCGPHDPEIARVLFPQSLRAQLGEDRVRNAVHCTDLPEDGPLEAEFFFRHLAAAAAAAASATA